MHGESPEFKRCCFCLPLRRGLLAWGYAKLALNLLCIAYMVAIIVWCTRRFRRVEPTEIAIYTVMSTLLLIDLSFDILFIVASHKKSVKLLNVSYIYNSVWLGLVILLNCFQLYVNLYSLNRLWDYVDYRMYLVLDFAFSAGLAFSIIFVQIYLILLIRSEMAKLRKQSLEMQFSNHLVSGEPQCTVHNAPDADRCEGKTQVAQVCCSDQKQVAQDLHGQNASCCTNGECSKAKIPV